MTVRTILAELRSLSEAARWALARLVQPAVRDLEAAQADTERRVREAYERGHYYGRHELADDAMAADLGGDGEATP